jgi:hypothetical protein
VFVKDNFSINLQMAWICATTGFCGVKTKKTSSAFLNVAALGARKLGFL